jgi:tripartite-type tricarboxylate transporter receptor subunit TctC
MNTQIVSLVSILFTMILSSSAGLAQTPYYAGKTITLVAGTNAGDVYDLYARHFAQFLPKYIPGNPDIVVQNMAGAGSMIAANFVYNVANPDGLTIGAIHPELYLNQLAGRSEVEYDWSKFAWIGSPATSNYLLYMRADSPYLTINHAVKANPAAKCGATATSSTAFYIPRLLDEMIGTNFDVILGYQTGRDIDLAVERNEVDCRAFTLTEYFAEDAFRTWRKNRFVRVLVQTGRKRDPRIKNAPTIYELMDQYKTPEAERNLANLVLAASVFGRPYVMPPNTPAEQMEIIRAAFEKVLKDEAAIAAAKKRKLDLGPRTGDELEKLAKEVITRPPEVVAKLKALLEM